MRFKMSLSVILCLWLVNSVWAHEGHDHVPGDGPLFGTSDVITISPQARQNLNIKSYAVDVVALDKTVRVFGSIEPIPSRVAAVASRISGRVSAIHVNDGEVVRKGQPLVEVESLQLGDPPPRVTYAAPFDGAVIDRQAALGLTVDPDRYLIQIADLTEVYVKGAVYEQDIAQIRVGQNVRVVAEAFPKVTYQGSIALIGGALDQATATLPVWVKLANPDLRLRPSMRATLWVVVSTASQVIGVPHQAILGDSSERFVLVESDNDPLTFARRLVVIGERDDRFTEVTQGILPGEKVVVEGGYQLQYAPPSLEQKKEAPGAELAH